VPLFLDVGETMNTLEYIMHRFNLNGCNGRLPVEIPDFGRDGLGTLFRELGFTVGVEVGTFEAEYAEVLCKANPAMELYGVDPWARYDETDYYNSDKRANDAYQIAVSRMVKYRFIPIRKMSMDAVKDFEDDALDFVYVDGNHRLEFVINDIAEWGKKVRVGGIVAGHDYIEFRVPKHNKFEIMVVKAVQVYAACYGINPWFVLGRQAKGEGLIRDEVRSWMWVKS